MIFWDKKLLQIRRDLIESFVRHILKVSGSKSGIQNFSALVSDKSEISPIWEDRYRVLHLNDDIVLFFNDVYKCTVFLYFFRYFTKILNISIPVTQYRLGALLTGFYDCSGLPGPPRASADLLGRSPRPLELPATLSATDVDIQFSDQKHLRTASPSWGS